MCGNVVRGPHTEFVATKTAWKISFMIVAVVLFVFAKFLKKMRLGSQENSTARLNPFDEFFDR